MQSERPLNTERLLSLVFRVVQRFETWQRLNLCIQDYATLMKINCIVKNFLTQCFSAICHLGNYFRPLKSTLSSTFNLSGVYNLFWCILMLYLTNFLWVFKFYHFIVTIQTLFMIFLPWLYYDLYHWRCLFVSFSIRICVV